MGEVMFAFALLFAVLSLQAHKKYGWSGIVILAAICFSGINLIQEVLR